MEPYVTHGAGLDIHQRLIVATVLAPDQQETRSFGTTTAEVLALADWLTTCGVPHVAMEATGVYWKPIYNLLEQDLFEAVWVVNPQHIKGMKGRKTDVQDSQWIAHLLHRGALHPSYLPTRPQRELREVVRYRQTLIQARSAEANRLQKVLEGANVKLSNVLSDILGKSGQRILHALVQGETDPATLAALADDRVRATPATLAAALQGRIGAHQQLMLHLQLEHVAFLDRQIEALSDEMGARLSHEDDARTRLETIPGGRQALSPVVRRTAETIVAEVGPAMPRVPSAGHLVSWAGFSPGQNESGGKAKPAPTRQGSKALREAVTEAGRAASRPRTYLGAVYHRLAGRRGANRAATAVGRHILIAAYHLLTTPGTVYQDLGANHFDERDRAAVIRRATRRLEALGVRVTVELSEPVAS